MSHTPGPYTDCFEGNTVIVSGGPNNDDLAEFFHCDEATVSVTREEAEANARLFIAAPDLLSALESLISAYGDRTWGTVYAMERALPYAREVVAKATGESP